MDPYVGLANAPIHEHVRGPYSDLRSRWGETRLRVSWGGALVGDCWADFYELAELGEA